MKLSKKVAVVTGTSPNIGGGIAQGLADEGAIVACVDVAAENAVVSAVNELLPSVVTVINYVSNGQPQSSGSGFVDCINSRNHLGVRHWNNARTDS